MEPDYYTLCLHLNVLPEGTDPARILRRIAAERNDVVDKAMLRIIADACDRAVRLPHYPK